MEVLHSEFNTIQEGRGVAVYYLEINDLELLIYNITHYKQQKAKSYKNTASFAIIDVLLDKLINDRVLVRESPIGPSARVLMDDMTLDIIKCIMEYVHQEADGGMFEAQARAILDEMNKLESYV